MPPTKYTSVHSTSAVEQKLAVSCEETRVLFCSVVFFLFLFSKVLKAKHTWSWTIINY